MTDVISYNGPLERMEDLRFIEFLAEQKTHDDIILILVTPGGNPDAAYKIARYIQSAYSSFRCFIPGICKSAGTLLAVGAEELIFSPYGELGPLDVQLNKSDDLFGQESGLNISEAFRAVETRARNTFHQVIGEIVSGSGGVISFQTASHCGAEIVGSLYGPIFANIDPEEVGSRARAMRLGEDYGVRLNQKFANLKQGALAQLSQSYSSHGFVIDRDESGALFERVREATEVEKALIAEGRVARFPKEKVTMHNFTDLFKKLNEDAQRNKADNDPNGDSQDGNSSEGAVAEPKAKRDGGDTAQAG